VFRSFLVSLGAHPRPHGVPVAAPAAPEVVPQEASAQ
jgi:hypothetical protein